MSVDQRNQTFKEIQQKHLPPLPTLDSPIEALNRPNAFIPGANVTFSMPSSFHPGGLATPPRLSGDLLSPFRLRRSGTPTKDKALLVAPSPVCQLTPASVSIVSLGLSSEIFQQPKPFLKSLTSIVVTERSGVISHPSRSDVHQERCSITERNTTQVPINHHEIQREAFKETSKINDGAGVAGKDSQSEMIDQMPQLKRRRRVVKRGSVSDADVIHQVTPLLLREPHLNSLADPGLTLVNPERSSKANKKQRYRNRWKYCVYNEPGTIHTLPLVLSASQNYECLVQWEAEEETELDSAKLLWRELECEYATASPVPASTAGQCMNGSGRGRWKVKLVKTPIIQSSEPDQVDPVTRSDDASRIRLHHDDWGGIFQGTPILREVEDLLPSVNKYRRLSTAINRQSALRGPIIRRSHSQSIIHSDIKRALESMWEDSVSEAGIWALRRSGRHVRKGELHHQD
ncbi:hypothetical protein FRC17_003313 [Serendipita sp. 399]|nr:hypothetical protein FRC17_003313 [Serendipita sp. 399]